jgi:hypothetical protein
MYAPIATVAWVSGLGCRQLPISLTKQMTARAVQPARITLSSVSDARRVAASRRAAAAVSVTSLVGYPAGTDPGVVASAASAAGGQLAANLVRSRAATGDDDF